MIFDYGGKEIKKGSKTRFLWDNQKIEDKSLCDVYQRLYNKQAFITIISLMKEALHQH